MDMLLSTPAASVGAPDSLWATQNCLNVTISPHAMTQKEVARLSRMRGLAGAERTALEAGW